MGIKDIKAGGWVRFSYDGEIELAKVREFRYDKGFSNGYTFRFVNRDFGLFFGRKEFKYSDNVADLVKKNERIVGAKNRYFIGNSFTKDEFVKKFGGGGKK